MSLPLADALRICHLHNTALKGALQAAQLPISASQLQAASAERVRALDQAVLRYLKLQDTMGEHVLRSFVVEALEEPMEDKPMLDLLNRLERLGYLSTDDWLATRLLRNQLTHDYPEDPARQAEVLNRLPTTQRLIEDVMARIEAQHGQT